jgi:hypothetical protein
MSRLPYEIIHQILLYHGDIDIRRDFGLYGPIDKEKFSILNTIMRTANKKQRREFPNYLYQNYFLPNLYNIKDRINDDHIDIKVAIHDGKVKYDYGIYRLMPKSDNPVLGKYPSQAIAPDNYEWHSMTYSFDLS